ncbi:CBS domain-containing protein [Deferribacter autotrophicus]|uniref:CBS domain-containing protein n=1 Tax=Deferribacter autotrophicus TaxID=500465 RepID=A0A5A8F2F6_9BACT|nr:putative nucleotidyltransferase substrate binding domain-containing protein [Deferribacter autotrophicus]KAA0257075.1 CBS domain-containing protein [Deferribacter autotrophicus]
MINDEILNLLTNFYLFQGIEPDRLKPVAKNAEIVTLSKGDVIFYKGDKYHRGVYLIVEGTVVYKSDFGHEDIVLKPGDFVGLTTFLGKSKYLVTAICEEDSTLVFFPEVCIYKLMDEYDDFRDRFNSMVLYRISQIKGDKGSEQLLSSTFKSIGSYMSSPVITVNENEGLVDACKLMSKYRIGSIVVVDDDENVKGLLSSKDVIHNFFDDFENNLKDLSLAKYMDHNPIMLPPEFPLVEAFSEIQRKNEDYAIVARRNKPLGIISGKDILRVLFRNSSIFSATIDSSSTLDELKINFNELYKIAENMINNSKLTSEILPVISTMHISIQRKIYNITAEQYLEETGVDVRLIKHAVIIMGSCARKEAMLDPDQDNGFIFPDNITEEEKKYLMEFGAKFSDNLEYVGYEKCIGNIMVTNPEMANTVSGWKEFIGGWVDNPGDKGIRWSSIVFDLSLLHGEERLVWELRDFILEKISKKPAFLLQILESDSNLRIPISIFGKFIVEKEGKYKGKINLKRAALSFIVDVTRAFTLYKKMTALNTVERLKTLQRHNVLSEEKTANVLNAYEVVTDIIFNNQVIQAKNGEEVNKFVNPNELSLFNQERLKEALHTISKYLTTGLRYFRGSPF